MILLRSAALLSLVFTSACGGGGGGSVVGGGGGGDFPQPADSVDAINQFDSFEKAIYFSLVTFTTLGYGEITIESGSRILSGLEAVDGIMMIGWSTAFMFFVYQEIVKTEVELIKQDKKP